MARSVDSNCGQTTSRNSRYPIIGSGLLAHVRVPRPVPLAQLAGWPNTCHPLRQMAFVAWDDNTVRHVKHGSMTESF
jgi:hypothetical protein